MGWESDANYLSSNQISLIQILRGKVSKVEMKLLLVCYDELTTSSLTKQNVKSTVAYSIKCAVAWVRHSSMGY